MKRLIIKSTLLVTILLSLMLISILIARDSNSASANVNSMPIYRVDREEKWVALTFDVNWAERDYLEEILSVLTKNDVKATFFVMGKWVIYPEDKSDKLLAIKEGGHEIENHSYEHPDFQKITKERMRSEINKTEEIFKKYGIENKKMFRCPSGSYNEETLKVADEMGYKVVQWDVDSLDWKETGQEYEYSRVINNVKNGSIVLFHNNGKYTPANLDKIIKNLKNQGYEFKKIEEILYEKDYFINGEGIQKNNL